jgi:hypothetical protein
VKGPNRDHRPFGLDTKYGHLVFVFVSKSKLFDTFFEASAGGLKPGFTLETAAVIVPRAERLVAELAANMPGGETFRLSIEGTEEFTRHMHELADDTIWKD